MNVAPYRGSVVIDNISDAIEAVQAKLGIGASTPTTAGHHLRVTGSGATAFGALAAGDIANGLITSAMIADGTIATGDVAANAISQVSAVNVGTTSGPTTASSSPADLAEMTRTLTTVGGIVVVIFAGIFQHSVAGSTIALDLLLNGAAQIRREIQPGTANHNVNATVIYAAAPAAGSHTFKMQWLTTAATATSFSTQRAIIAMELKR